MAKITREELREDPLIIKLTQDMGEEPYWIAEDYYDLMWEWVNDSKFTNGTFLHWLEDEYLKCKKAKRRGHINNTIVNLNKKRNGRSG